MTHDDDNQKFEKIPLTAERKETLRKQAEAQVRTMDLTSLSAQTPKEIQQVLYELRVHQIELEMQNEELRTFQEQIEAGRARYFDLYDLAPVGYVTLSEKGVILEANLTLATLLGTARSVLVRQPISSFILKEDQDIYYLHRKQLFRSDEPQECELRMVKKDGTPFWAHLTTTAARAEDNTPVWREVISDITERKQAEEKLFESHALINNLARLVPGVIYQYRLYPDGRSAFPYSSPGMNDIYEVTPEEVREDAGPVFERLHPDDYDHVANAIQESARTLQEFYCEFRVILPRQGLRWRWSQAHPERTEDGGTLWHGIISDITERKLAEDALKGSLAEKEILLKEVHHRVKNNLASINGLISLQQDMLADPALGNEFSNLSGRIHSMSLVHEMLYQSKTLSRINLHDYFETLVSHIRGSYDPSARVNLIISAAGVEMDLDHAIPCGLIVNELVTNTFKYAFPEGKPLPGQDQCEITVIANWDGSAYTLAVSDNGVGFPSGFDWKNSRSLGLQLVMLLGQRQFKGQVELDGTAGAAFRLRFVPENHPGR